MKAIFAFFAVAALLLAGCASAPNNPPVKNNSSVEPTCPDVLPYCPPGAEMYSVLDSNGCTVYRCRDIVPPPEVNNSGQVPPPPPQMNNSSNTAPPPPPEANNSSQIAPPPPEEPVKEFTVEVAQWTYSPSIINVNKGDHVRIILKSLDVGHGFSIPQFNINIQAPAGGVATGEFTADKEGSFIFHCSVLCGEGHGSMSGVVVVKG